MKYYRIVYTKIKAGDFVINTIDKTAKPLKVSKSEHGHLGLELKGWFSWLPLGARHKKVIIIK